MITKKPLHTSWFTCCLSMLLCSPALLQAQSGDYSCISQDVLQKIQVSNRYLEFDVRLASQCQNPVTWSVCIEKLNPWTYDVVAQNTHSGVINNGENSRINMLTDQVRDPDGPDMNYEKFFLNIAYSADGSRIAECVATECLEFKKPLLLEKHQIDSDLDKAQLQLQRQISKDCSKGDVTDSGCEKKVTQIDRPYRESLRSRQAAIEAQLGSSGPAYCQLLPN